jgi:hypothetical protein
VSEDIARFMFTDAGRLQILHAVNSAETPSVFVAKATVMSREPSLLLEISDRPVGEAPLLAYDRKLKGAEKLGQDVENAIKVYDYVGSLSRAAATDPRFWSYLSLVTFAEYTNARWPLTNKNWSSRARSRWMVAKSRRGELVRNSISRLWWAAHLTVDSQLARPLSKQSGDPFAYLRVLLRKEDVLLGVIDRDTAMVPELLFAVLEHISQGSTLAREKYVRELMKEVVLAAGYSEFAGMSNNEIYTILAGMGERLK